MSFAAHLDIRVIDLMPDQKDVRSKGATMRLGAYPCAVLPGTLLDRCYGCAEVRERHRHRYEFNNTFRPQLESAGFVSAAHRRTNVLLKQSSFPAIVLSGRAVPS